MAKLLLTQKKYKEADKISLKPLPIAPYFREWKQEMYEGTAAASGRPQLCFKLIKAVERPGVTFEELAGRGDFDS